MAAVAGLPRCARVLAATRVRAAVARCACCRRCGLHFLLAAAAPHKLPPALTDTSTPRTFTNTNTGPAVELIRSKLPSHTLAALRLVCRAARDELVDGRCTALRPRYRFLGSVAPVLGAAPRLRCLETLTVPFVAFASDAAAFAALVARLPGGGAALREVRLGSIGSAAASSEQLAAAISAMSGLRLLKASALCAVAETAAPQLTALGAGIASTPSLLALGIDGGADAVEFDERLGALMPLGRLQRLKLSNNVAPAVLSQLAEPDAAAALTALRSLKMLVWGWGPGERPSFLQAPWLSQLTRLRLDGLSQDLNAFAAALPPGSLLGLRELDIAASTNGPDPPALAHALFTTACNPAALQTLSLSGFPIADTVRTIEALPALASLRLSGDEELQLFSAGILPVAPAKGYCALASAHLAPLTTFALYVPGLLARQPSPLTPLLSAPWAASVRELTLQGSQVGIPLRLLVALSSMRHLRTFHLHRPRLDRGELRQAAAEGWFADGWPARLVHFDLRDLRAMVYLIDYVLAAFPFSWRLERLDLIAGFDSEQRADQVAAKCVRALPSLKHLTIDNR